MYNYNMEFEYSGQKNKYINKIILAIVISVLLLIIGYYTGNKYLYQNTTADTTYDYAPNSLDYIVKDANADPDNDGIANWRENLLGTNPNSANTGPVNTSLSTESTTTLNLTDEVAKSIYTIANTLNTSKDTTTPTVMAVASAIADQALTSKSIDIKEQNIIVVSDNSREAIKDYANKLFGFIIVYYPKVNEAAVMDAFLKKEDANILKDLQPNVDSLNIMISGIYKIKVPSEAFELHKQVLISLIGARDTEVSLMKANSDSLSAMIAVKNLQSSGKKYNDLIKQYKTFFDNKNVVFGAKDPGSIVNR